MSQVIKVTFVDGNEWKLPFNFALGLHIVLIFSAVYMPDFLYKKPIYPDIYTIDLVNVQIPMQEPEPVAELPSPQPKKAVSVTPPQKQIEPVKPIKPVSIKPLKRKKIKKTSRVDDSQKRQLEQLHKQRVKEALEAEKKAQEAAELAAAQAVEQLKQMLRETNIQAKAERTPTPSARSQKPSKNTNIVEKQYFASIFNTIQPHWKLPETKVWSPDLVATIVIHVSKSGEVIKYFFEKKSGDRLFDQFVLKAIQAGTPLPPIPKALQKNSLEIGLHFKPGSIQY